MEFDMCQLFQAVCYGNFSAGMGLSLNFPLDFLVIWSDLLVSTARSGASFVKNVFERVVPGYHFLRPQWIWVSRRTFLFVGAVGKCSFISGLHSTTCYFARQLFLVSRLMVVTATVPIVPLLVFTFWTVIVVFLQPHGIVFICWYE